jgi:hypothetical protein
MGRNKGLEALQIIVARRPSCTAILSPDDSMYGLGTLRLCSSLLDSKTTPNCSHHLLPCNL